MLIDRGDYWQCAYLIRKGSDAALRAAGIEELRRRFAALLPWLADRVDQLRSWDDVQLLDVRLERLRRWDRDGLLLIGDAAHAMSPVGGVGINLAVQDAVAAARVLAPALASGGIVPRSVLRRVQRRRWWPTVLIQGFSGWPTASSWARRSARAPGAPTAGPDRRPRPSGSRRTRRPRPRRPAAPDRRTRRRESGHRHCHGAPGAASTATRPLPDRRERRGPWARPPRVPAGRLAPPGPRCAGQPSRRA